MRHWSSASRWNAPGSAREIRADPDHGIIDIRLPATSGLHPLRIRALALAGIAGSLRLISLELSHHYYQFGGYSDIFLATLQHQEFQNR